MSIGSRAVGHTAVVLSLTLKSKPKAEGGRGKAAKDPNKPKRAVSAYFFFLADCRENAKKEGRSISKIAEFTKECSAKWRELDSVGKKPYDDQAAADKVRYDREMRSYGGKGSKKATRDPTQPKRPLSGYFLFLADFRQKMANSNLEHKEILKLAGKEWGEMTNEAKLPYEKQSQEEQRKYDIAMAEWRKSVRGAEQNNNHGSTDDQLAMNSYYDNFHSQSGGGQQKAANGAGGAAIEIDDDDEDDYEDEEEDDE